MVIGSRIWEVFVSEWKCSPASFLPDALDHYNDSENIKRFLAKNPKESSYILWSISQLGKDSVKHDIYLIQRLLWKRNFAKMPENDLNKTKTYAITTLQIINYKTLKEFLKKCCTFSLNLADNIHDYSISWIWLIFCFSKMCLDKTYSNNKK